jgi:hypothetical protein
MSTGIQSWNVDLLGIGPMYPFVGWEVVLVIIGLASWVIWHIIQMRAENETLAAEEEHYANDGRLEQAMQISSAETLIEAMKAHGQNYERR